jgi:hypothetical protein
MRRCTDAQTDREAAVQGVQTKTKTVDVPADANECKRTNILNPNPVSSLALLAATLKSQGSLLHSTSFRGPIHI